MFVLIGIGIVVIVLLIVIPNYSSYKKREYLMDDFIAEKRQVRILSVEEANKIKYKRDFSGLVIFIVGLILGILSKLG